MNKTLKRLLLLAAVVCMMSALFVAVAATTSTNTCVHVWNVSNQSLVDIPADANPCKVYGVYKDTCAKCGEVKYVQRLAHVLEKGFVEATCTEPRMAGYVCTTCKAGYGTMTPATGADAAAAKGHAYVEESVPATCLEPAGMLITCTRCDLRQLTPYTGTNAAPALGHQEFTSVFAKASTCFTKGNTAEIRCTRCCPVGSGKDPLVKSVELPLDPNNHEAWGIWVITQQANCATKTDGYGKYHCAVCHYGEAEGQQKTVTIPWEHNYVKVGEYVKTPTCEDGLMNVECSVCHDKQYNVVAPAVAQHVFVEKTIDPDCVNPGKKGMICSVCGLVNGELEIDPAKPIAKGHALVNTIYKTPNCIYPSGLIAKCSVEGCDYFEHHDVDGIVTKPATGHTAKAGANNVEATCKTAGWAGHSVCADCGVELSKGAVVPADPDAHDLPDEPVAISGAEANCVTGKDGYGKYVCTVCEKTVKYVTMSAEEYGHDWSEPVVVTKGATAIQNCGKDIEYKRTCLRADCGKEDVYTVKATGKHVWEDGQYIDADCENPKRLGQKCSKCGAAGKVEVVVGENAVAALGHDFDNEDEQYYEVYETANCKYPAGVLRYCANAGCTETSFKAFVEGSKPLDHVPEQEESKKATCKTTGYEGAVYCKLCGDKLADRVILPIDATNHDFAQVGAPIDNPDCTTLKDGIANFKCNLCGYETFGVVKYQHEKDSTKPVVVVKKATCTEKGEEKFFCKVCEKYVNVATEAAGHKMSVVYTEAYPYQECGKPNKAGQFCTVCGLGKDKMTVVGGAPRQHEWVEEEIKEANCETPAGLLVKCKYDCGEKQFFPTVPGAVASHTPKKVDDKPATCLEPGYKDKVICTKCNETLEITVLDIDPEAHNVIVKKEIVESNCVLKQDGIGKYECEYCGLHFKYASVPYDYKHQAIIAAAEKNPVIPATCSTEGKVEAVCPDCGLTVVSKKIPATGNHAFPAENNYTELADCLTPAFVAKKCANCNALKDITYVPGSEALGHKFTEEVVEADCVNPSRIKKTCSRANCPLEGGIEYEALPEDVAVPALGHIEKSGDVEATCMTTGWKGKVVCERCKKDVQIGEQTPINPENHNISKVPSYVAPGVTCYKPGVATFKCLNANCNYQIAKEDYTTAHVLEGQPEKVSEDKTYIYKQCAICTHREIVEYLVEPCKHQEEKVEAVAPTCTEPGKTEGTICSICNEVIKAQEEVPALGHKEVDVPAVEATCAKEGLTAGKQCSVCEEFTVKQEPVEKLAHTEVEIAAVAATCTEEGSTAGKKCSVCEEIIVAVEKIEALGHKEVVVEGKAATCTEAGYTESSTCSVCNEVVKAKEEIKALGHTEEVVAGKEATCGVAGLTEGKKCSVCGEITVAQVEIPALAHKYTVSWDFNADFTKKVKTYTCEVCGHSYSEEMDF